MGRRLKARVPLPEQPGRLLELFKVVQRYGGVVDYVRHSRNGGDADWDQVWVTIECKMSCLKATNELKHELKRLHPKAEFPAENLIPQE